MDWVEDQVIPDELLLKQIPLDIDSPYRVEDLNIESILNNKDRLLALLEKDLEIYE